MITAEFENETYTKAYGLWQWDTGRKLKITGIPVTENTIEVHFATEGDKEAIPVIGKVEEKEILADIPNSLLKTGRDLVAYVYVRTKAKGVTVCKAHLYVKPRAKPKDYEDPGDTELLGQLMEALKKKGDGLRYENQELQLLSGETPIGNKVQIPGSGAGNITSITITEIDEIMEGE